MCLKSCQTAALRAGKRSQTAACAQPFPRGARFLPRTQFHTKKNGSKTSAFQELAGCGQPTPLGAGGPPASPAATAGSADDTRRRKLDTLLHHVSIPGPDRPGRKLHNPWIAKASWREQDRRPMIVKSTIRLTVNIICTQGERRCEPTCAPSLTLQTLCCVVLCAVVLCCVCTKTKKTPQGMHQPQSRTGPRRARTVPKSARRRRQPCAHKLHVGSQTTF